MITDAQGRPISHDGPTGRKIEIIEMNDKGKPVWAVNFTPSLGAYQSALEVLYILADVAKGFSFEIMLRNAEAKANAKVQAKINDLKEK